MIKIKHIQEVEDGKVVKTKYEIWEFNESLPNNYGMYIAQLTEEQFNELKEEIKKYENTN